MMAGGLTRTVAGGNFYAVFPHNFLALVFGVAFLYAVFALGVAVTKLWRQISPQVTADPRDRDAALKARAPAAAEAAMNVATMKYLDGGHGEGCNDEDDRFTLARRRFHHFTLYGFLLCFAATSVATLYHYVLGLLAPYAWSSLPVLLGVVGGLGLIIGPAGLFWLNLKRHPMQGDPAQQGMDRGFIALLLLTSVTGFAVLILRETSAMPVLLAVHLGVVMALFLTLPYGKFAHGVFRGAALLKFAIEKRLANRLACCSWLSPK